MEQQMKKDHSWESESLKTGKSVEIEIPKIPESIPVEILQPEIKVTKKVDQFGFYNDTLYKHVDTNQGHIKKQEQDWINITNDWQNSLGRKQQKIKKLTREGIPESMRGKVWFLLAGADRKLVKGRYEELISITDKPQIFEIIERDIHRCFPSKMGGFNPDHVMFAEKDGPGQRSLRQVLQAYALYNPVLGYCQGMGMIVGLLLMRMNPEDSFWTLVCILENFIPDYHSVNLYQLRVDAAAFEVFLKKYNRPLAKHMKELLPLTYLSQWFLTLYILALPWPTVLRVWDMFLHDGPKALFRVGLAIMMKNKKNILNCPSSSDILGFLLSAPKELDNPDQFIRECLKVGIKHRQLVEVRRQDKSSAVQELNRWIADQSTQSKLNQTGWQVLTDGLCHYLSKELSVHAEKSLEGNKNSQSAILIASQLFKETVELACRKKITLNNDLLTSVMTVLEDYFDVKQITKALSQCLHYLVSVRSFRDQITQKQFENLLTYCIDFFTESNDKENNLLDKRDTRGESADLVSCFAIIVSCCHEHIVIFNGKGLLDLVKRYFQLYSVENQAFELFLGVSLRILILLDVNELELSYSFLKYLYPKFLEFLNSKNQTVRLYSVNLLRMYISIGSQRSDDDGSNSFLKSNSRIFKELIGLLAGKVSFNVHLDYAYLLADPTICPNPVSDEVCLKLAFVYLCADVFWLELQGEGDIEDTQSSSQSKLSASNKTPESGSQKKRLKLENPKSIILDFLRGQWAKTLIQPTTAQILNLIVLRRPDMANLLLYEFGTALVDLLSSHEDSISHFACLTLSNFFKYCDENELWSFDFSAIWDSATGLVESKASCLPFSLLDTLMTRGCVKTPQIIDCMNKFTSLSAWFINPVSLSCLQSLLKYSNLWDKVLVSALFARFLKLTAFLAKQQEFESYRHMINFFNALLYEGDSFGNISEVDRPIQQDSLLFNFCLSKFESRLILASGFNGKLIATKYLGFQCVESSVSPILNDVRFKLLLTIISDFLSEFNVSPSCEKEICGMLGSLVLITTLLDYSSDSSDNTLLKKLNDFGEMIISNSSALSKDQMGNLLLPLRYHKSAEVLAPLPVKLSLKLYETWERLKKGKIVKFRECDAAEPLFELAFLGENFEDSEVTQFDLYLKVSLIFSRQDGLSWSVHSKDLVLEFMNWKSISHTRFKVLNWREFSLEEEFAKDVLELFRSYLKNDNSGLVSESCLQFLARMFKASPNLIANNFDIRKNVLLICKHFLEGLKLQTLSISLRLHLVELILEIFSQPINSVASEIDTTEICWDIFGVNNLEVVLSALRFIPKLISVENPVASFSDIVHYIPTRNNSLVRSVGAAIVFGKILIKCPLLRADAVRSLFFVAADHPSLDTVENVLSVAADNFGFSSFQSLAERYLDEVLDVWGLNYDSFPTFICGYDDVKEFTSRFVDKIAVQCFRSGNFSQISLLESHSNNLKARIFGKLYTFKILHAEESQVGAMDAFLNEHFVQLPSFINRNTSSIAANIFLSIRGIQTLAPSTPLLVRTGLHQIGLESNLANNFKTIAFPVNTVEKAISALKILFECEFEDIANHISSTKLQNIFQKYHLLVNSYAKDPVVPILFFNGYQLLLIMANTHLGSPFILQPSIFFLCQHIDGNSEVSFICIRLIRYLIKMSAPNETKKFIHHQSSNLIAMLDRAMNLAFDSKSYSLVKEIVVCMEQILEITFQYASEVEDLTKFKAAFTPLNPELTCYSPIFKKFSVPPADLASMSYWFSLTRGAVVSSKLFGRISLLLNDVEILKHVDKSTVLSFTQSLYSVISSGKCVAAPIVECYAKLLMYYPGGTLKSSDHVFEKFADQEALPCYYGYVFTIDQLVSYLNNSDLNIVIVCNKVLASLCSTAEGAQAVLTMEDYLQNYLSVYKDRKAPAQSQLKQLDFNNNLFHDNAVSEDEWLAQISKQLLRRFDFPVFFQSLLPMLEVSSGFAELMLPVLFHYILLCNHQNDEKSNESIVSSLRDFFASNCGKHSFRLRHMLDTIKFLLKVDTEYVFFNSWNDLDFSDLATAAFTSEDFTFTIYLLEFHCHKNSSILLSSTSWDHLLYSYKKLNDVDAFHGIVAVIDPSITQPYQLIVQKNYHDNNWLSLWSLEDSIIQSNSSVGSNHLFLQSLANSGHFHTLNQISGCHYESLWRLGKWDVKNALDDIQLSNFDQCVYNCLERISNSTSYSNIFHSLDQHLIKFGECEKVDNLLPFLEMKEAFSVLMRKLSVKDLRMNWQERSKILGAFQSETVLEKIYAIRTRLITILSDSKLDGVQNLLRDHYFELVEFALKNGNIQLARTTILQLKMSVKLLSRLDILKADSLGLQIDWASGEEMIAMKFYKALLSQLGSEEEIGLKAEMLNQFGQWAILSRRYPPMKIIEEFLEPAISICAENENLGKYYYDLAKYSDNVLQEMNDDDTQIRSAEILERRIAEVQKISRQPHSKTNEHFIRKNNRQIELDRASIQAFSEKKSAFLLTSVRNYIEAISNSSSKSEIAVFRLVSLWLSHHLNLEVNLLIQKNCKRLPSKGFIVLMYQLAARLSSQDPDPSTPFYATLSDFLENVICDYPFHTLGYILALNNVKKGSGKTNQTSKNISYFLKRIMKSSSLKSITVSMSKLFNAYIEIARKPIERGSKNLSLDSGMAILGIKSDPLMPVLTYELPAGLPRDYSSIIYIVRVESKFSLPGGINNPKAIKCLGSDGKIHKQLVKANDDLRQDAVISSVFSTINRILEKKRESRSLKISTYKIVPISEQMGIVQWVDGTIPMGELLVQAYRKTCPSWMPQKCREKFKAEQEKKTSTLASKLEIFQEIKQKLPVVFGSWFFAEYRDPITWYNQRNSYMRSLAASSIGVYIMGVGDRHSQNILFDKATGEVIHIDLGIAFDQGKLLSIPETVPFRLTRNIVDAMGIIGCEGVFKRGCERTLRMIKEEKDIIFTLLDVFRHDPLYSWAISPLKLKKLQAESSNTPGDDNVISVFANDEVAGNAEADIALFGVRKKLTSTLSVECQVQELIQTATDEKNLVVMFNGWQAYL